MFRLNNQNVAYSVLKAAEKDGITVTLSASSNGIDVKGPSTTQKIWVEILRPHKDELFDLFDQAAQRERKP